MKKNRYEGHPIANELPMLPPDELMALAADIKAKGCRLPVVLFEDKILDGRNRYEACLMAGVEPPVIDYQGDDPIGYVESMSLRRRDMTPGVKAAAALRFETMRLARKASGDAKPAATQTAIASKAHVSRSTVQRAVKAAKGTKVEQTSWTADELKANDNEMGDLFTAIEVGFGKEDTKAIRTGIVGLNKVDVVFLAKLPMDKMLQIQDLVMAERMKPKHAFEFMNKMADDYSEVRELIQWCVGTKGKFWEANFRDGAFTVTVKANRAIKRP